MIGNQKTVNWHDSSTSVLHHGVFNPGHNHGYNSLGIYHVLNIKVSIQCLSSHLVPMRLLSHTVIACDVQGSSALERLWLHHKKRQPGL